MDTRFSDDRLQLDALETQAGDTQQERSRERDGADADLGPLPELFFAPGVIFIRRLPMTCMRHSGHITLTTQAPLPCGPRGPSTRRRERSHMPHALQADPSTLGRARHRIRKLQRTSSDARRRKRQRPLAMRSSFHAPGRSPWNTGRSMPGLRLFVCEVRPQGDGMGVKIR